MGSSCSCSLQSKEAQVLPSLTAEALENLEIISRHNSFNNEGIVLQPKQISSKKRNWFSTRSSGTSISMSLGASSRSEMLNQVNPANFPAYNVVSKRVWEGQKALMKSSSLRSGFINYLYSMVWIDKLSMQLLTQIIKRRRTQDTHEVTFNDYSVYPRSRASSHDNNNNNNSPSNTSNNNGSQQQDAVANTMRRCTQLKIKDSMDRSLDRSSAGYHSPGAGREGRGGGGAIGGIGADFFQESCLKLEEMQLFSLATIWPIYLESEEYRAWLQATTSSHSNASSSLKTLGTGGGGGEAYILYDDPTSSDQTSSPPVHLINTSSRRSSRDQALDFERSKGLRELYYTSIKQWPEEQLQAVLKTGSWLDKLPLWLDKSCPYAVSIAAVSPIPALGLPLIFVNQAFETTTLYGRSEVLGKPCKFLHCDKTEADQLAKIADALTKREGVKVALTNMRKDGSEFCNFLALKPVLDPSVTSSEQLQQQSMMMTPAQQQLLMLSSPRVVLPMKLVLGVAYDITKDEASLKELKVIEDLMAILATFLRG